jgi:hypothetical protein
MTIAARAAAIVAEILAAGRHVPGQPKKYTEPYSQKEMPKGLEQECRAWLEAPAVSRLRRLMLQRHATARCPIPQAVEPPEVLRNLLIRDAWWSRNIKFLRYLEVIYV